MLINIKTNKYMIIKEWMKKKKKKNKNHLIKYKYNQIHVILFLSIN